ncbi:hypothetical protein LCGC14_2274530 [marine sediment metagenome]|uniref:Uncharacterized protein n=1 Tax=marine sediment metagenome TaxID=412755 RepID=A0A0F9CVY7_9ZZZZ
MSNIPVQATRADLAEGARKQYEFVCREAHDWLSTIPQAIDAWEREPELKEQLAEAQEEKKKDVYADCWNKLIDETAEMHAQITELTLLNSDLSRENEAYADGMKEELVIAKTAHDSSQNDIRRLLARIERFREHIKEGEETILWLQAEVEKKKLKWLNDKVDRNKKLKEARRYARMYYQRNKVQKRNIAVLDNQSGVAADFAGLELKSAYERIEELEAEIARVAPFLAVHGFGGYEFGEFIPNEENPPSQ